jgi:6-phosphogluconolactonase (cycloisomerase 2 family)
LLSFIVLMSTVLAWASSPRFAYVTNANDNTVSAYAVDSVTGQLRANGYAISGSGPTDVAVVMDKFVYVTNAQSNNLASFSINGNGTLRGTGIVGTQASPFAIATHPSNKFIYVTNSGSTSVSGYAVNAATGTLTPIAGSPFGAGRSPRGLVVTPNGAFLYVANGATGNVSAFKINLVTGALTSIGNFSAGTSPRALVVDKSGRFLYVANLSSGDVTAFRISSTGTLTLLHSFFVGGNPRSVVIDLSGKFLYVGSDVTNQISGFSINSVTGTLTALSPAAVPAQVSGVRDLAVAQSNAFLYVVGTGSRAVEAFRIATSGNLTPILRDKVRTRGQGTSIAISGGALPLAFSSKFVYVTADNSNDSGDGKGSIQSYAIGSTGVLQALSSINVDGIPQSTTIDPFNRFIYTGNGVSGVGVGSNSISGFLLNGSTGAFTKVAGSPVLTGAAPDSVAIDPSGRFLFALIGASKTLVTYQVSSSGALSKLSSVSAAGAGELAVDPIGTFLFLSSASSTTTFRINPVSGGLVPTSMASIAGIPTVDPTGKFLYLDLFVCCSSFGGGVSTFVINPVSGTLLASVPNTATGRPTAFDPSGKFFYAAEFGVPLFMAQVLGFTTGASSGKLTSIPGSPFTAPFDNQAVPTIAVDFSGKFVIGVWGDDGELLGGIATFSTNNSTGALTLGPVITLGPNGFMPHVSTTRNAR